MAYIDLLLFTLAWLLAQWLFQGYEAHVPLLRRFFKFGVLALVLFAIRVLVGRVWFYGLLALLSVGIAVLHVYWFDYRHGIHWRRAEPRDEYLELIGRSDRNARDAQD